MKKKEITPIHQKPKIIWVVFKRNFKLLAPIPFTYTIPDLKLFKKHKMVMENLDTAIQKHSALKVNESLSSLVV